MRAARRPLAAALVALLAAGLTAACTGGSSGGSAPGLGDVRRVLAGHGAAVRDRHAGTFDDALAQGRAAAGFRARERAAFAHLAGVPLAGWTYTVAARTTDRGAERAATRRYGTAAVIVRVTLGYRLAGVDARTSRHDLWWTFVRQQGRVRIAGDDDLAGSGGVSWRGPWDFGAVTVVHGARSLVLGHPGTPTATLRAVAAAVDDAVPAVTAVWGTAWARRVAVLVPASAAELAADAGADAGAGGAGGSGTPAGSDVAALAVSDDSAQATTGAAGDPPGAEPPGQRLIVGRAAFGRLSAVGRRIVFRHEVTHIATAGATSAGTPRWVVEGFAEYVGNLGSGQSVPAAAAELRAAVAKDGLPDALPGDSALGDPATAAAAYQQAWLACRLIAARAGQAGLVRFYRQAAGAAVTGDPVTQALRAVLHESPARFVAQWRAALATELGVRR